MARKPKEVKTEDAAEDIVKNIMGSVMNAHKDDIYNFVSRKEYNISTGSLSLDELVGMISTGTTVRLLGPPSSGKTSMALLFIYNYLITVPRSRGLYVNAEAKLSKDIKERSGLKFVYSPEDWNIGTVLILETNIFETMEDALEACLKTTYEKDEYLCCVLDSIDMLLLKNDAERPIGESTMPAGVPKMSKLLYRRIGHKIEKYQALMILTSQSSANIEISAYAKGPSRPVNASGGSAVAHCASLIIEAGPRYGKHLILEKEDQRPDSEKNKILGHYCPLTIRKSTNETESISIEIPIKYGAKVNSVWKSRDIVPLLFKFGLLKCEKNTYTFSEPTRIQAKEENLELPEKLTGLNKVYAFLDENKEPCNWFYERLNSVICTVNENNKTEEQSVGDGQL